MKGMQIQELFFAWQALAGIEVTALAGVDGDARHQIV